MGNMSFRVYLMVTLVVGAMGAHSPRDRIVNGTDAKLGEYPFQVSLRFNDIHSCGASILNENWVLTAAHCVYKKDPWFSVQAGTITISEDQDTIIDVANIVIHEKYDPSDQYINDIAVLELENSLSLSSLIQPVQLPTQMENTPAGSLATVVGWGLPYTGGVVETTLQTVDVIVYSDADCSNAHDGVTHPSNICAGVPEGGKGECSGDSGGPLLVNGHQVGIVSWSKKPCGIKGYPNVYTEVAYYIDWINQQISSRRRT